MARQYFYLVAYRYDECTIPRKIFLQEHEAIQWGRREATKKLLETQDHNYEYILYRQEITRSGDLQIVKTLKPYPTKELVKAGLVTKDDNLNRFKGKTNHEQQNEPTEDYLKEYGTGNITKESVL